MRLLSRPGLDWSAKFPLLIMAIARLKCRSCLIDGEVIAHNEDGFPDFKALRSREPPSLCAFDLLEIDRRDAAWRSAFRQHHHLPSRHRPPQLPHARRVALGGSASKALDIGLDFPANTVIVSLDDDIINVVTAGRLDRDVETYRVALAWLCSGNRDTPVIEHGAEAYEGLGHAG